MRLLALRWGQAAGALPVAIVLEPMANNGDPTGYFRPEEVAGPVRSLTTGRAGGTKSTSEGVMHGIG